MIKNAATTSQKRGSILKYFMSTQNTLGTGHLKLALLGTTGFQTGGLNIVASELT